MPWSRLVKLQIFKEKMKPEFEEWALKHEGKRPCVEKLLDFFIEEQQEIVGQINE